jgi:hypothetical protein
MILLGFIFVELNKYIFIFIFELELELIVDIGKKLFNSFFLLKPYLFYYLFLLFYYS